MKNFRTYDLAMRFYEECQKMKATGELKLNAVMRDQFERAALSICLNLCEGSAKSSAKERRKFYRTSLGSLREVQCILTLIHHAALLKQADLLGAHLYRLCLRT